MKKKVSNKKTKKKGYTLVELLAVIVIIATIAGISVGAFLGIIKTSKENASSLAMTNLKEAAELYGKEKSSNINWNTFKNSNTEYKYICMTVLELVNSGYFNKDFYKSQLYNKKITENTFIKMEQTNNYDELNIQLVEEENKEICEAKAFKEIAPSSIPDYEFNINETSNYSDRFLVDFNMTYKELRNNVYFKGKISEKEYECSPDKDNCTFNGLKSNTNYNYKICIYPKKELNIENFEWCRTSETKTLKIKAPSIDISIDNNIDQKYKVNIVFYDTNIYEGESYHYFKSEAPGTTTTKNILLCNNSNSNPTTCTGPITEIKVGRWYYTKENNITIATNKLTPYIGNKLNINAITKDKSGNEGNTERDIEPNLKSCTITYNLNGGTNDNSNPISYNISNSTKVLKSPRKVGYTFTGWTGSNGGTPQKNLTIMLNQCDLIYTANWTRSFTCAQAGKITTYMGHEWYTNSNTDTYCDLSLNETVGASGGNKYNDATNEEKGVYNYIKNFDNGIDKLSEEKIANLVYDINTNSGTNSAPNGLYWTASGVIYDSSDRTVYGKANATRTLYIGSYYTTYTGNNNTVTEMKDRTSTFNTSYLSSKLKAGTRNLENSKATYTINDKITTPTITSSELHSSKEGYASDRFTTYAVKEQNSTTDFKHILYVHSASGSNNWTGTQNETWFVQCGGANHDKTAWHVGARANNKMQFINNIKKTDKFYAVWKNATSKPLLVMAGSAESTTWKNKDGLNRKYNFNNETCKNNWKKSVVNSTSHTVFYRPHIRVKK